MDRHRRLRRVHLRQHAQGQGRNRQRGRECAEPQAVLLRRGARGATARPVPDDGPGAARGDCPGPAAVLVGRTRSARVVDRAVRCRLRQPWRDIVQHQLRRLPRPRRGRRCRPVCTAEQERHVLRQRDLEGPCAQQRAVALHPRRGAVRARPRPSVLADAALVHGRRGRHEHPADPEPDRLPGLRRHNQRRRRGASPRRLGGPGDRGDVGRGHRRCEAQRDLRQRQEDVRRNPVERIGADQAWCGDQRLLRPAEARPVDVQQRGGRRLLLLRPLSHTRLVLRTARHDRGRCVRAEPLGCGAEVQRSRTAVKLPLLRL